VFSPRRESFNARDKTYAWLSGHHGQPKIATAQTGIAHCDEVTGYPRGGMRSADMSRVHANAPNAIVTA